MKRTILFSTFAAVIITLAALLVFSAVAQEKPGEQEADNPLSASDDEPAQPPEKKPEPVKAPVVKITNPRGGWTSERIIDVKGTVSDANITRLTLVVNGVPMTIRASGGSFTSKLVLSPGANTIQAIASNAAGVGRDAVSTYAKVPAKDMKITLTWDTDRTDIDMHVTDPAKEECYYQHKSTKMGGNLDVDVQNGFGPETFTLAHAVRGKPLGRYPIRGHVKRAARDAPRRAHA
jgi:uncharacterized protein YfaP (DUF2135 family)